MFTECVPLLTSGITIVLVSAQVSGWFCKLNDQEKKRPQSQLMIEDICVINSKVLGMLCQMSSALAMAFKPWEHGLHSYRGWSMAQLLPAVTAVILLPALPFPLRQSMCHTQEKTLRDWSP